MGLPEFAFAFFIFVLVCFLIFIYARIARRLKANDDAANDKEKRLYKLYQNLEDMMNGIEEYVEEARREIADNKEKVYDLLEKAIQLQKEIKAQEAKPADESAAKNGKEPVKQKEETSTKTLRNMKKSDIVLYMKQEGLDDEKIARELGISRGEVALILGIKK